MEISNSTRDKANVLMLEWVAFPKDVREYFNDWQDWRWSNDVAIVLDVCDLHDDLFYKYILDTYGLSDVQYVIVDISW